MTGFDRVHRAILRTFALAAAAACVFTTIAAAASGDLRSLLTRGLLSAVIALYALWRLRRGMSAEPLLFFTMVATIVSVAIRQDAAATTNAMFAMVGLTLAATLLARHPLITMSLGAFGVAIVTGLRYWIVDESIGELVAAAIVPLIVVVFGAQLMEWAKAEISGRQRRFENIFDHVPVAIWEEDFSRVAEWLDELRASGVEDLRAHLAANVDDVLHGASLIHVTGVNSEVLRFLEATDRESLLGPLNPDLLVEDGIAAMVEELVAVWDGTASLRVDLTGASTAGNPIEGYLLMAAPSASDGIDWSQVVVAIVDVREQRDAQRRLEELVDSKDRFVASVSHELRTPLTAVIGLAEELRTDVDVISEDERLELLSLISDQAIEVGFIVEDLLVAAQANIGRVKIQPEVVDVNREFVALLATMGERRSPVLEIGADTVVAADPRRLRQILRNLVTNADRYGRGAVSVHAFSEGPSTIVEVRDDGDGIPDDLREKVFEPYETAHRSTGVTGSMGLGLTVSRELARLMGGDLQYLRIDGETIFRLVLPAPADHARMVS
ncbi:MAG: HAMP domain-containing sensor histidine kinase [Acidimicrobiia bacterium]|nr:HAMP domain-containing sensor histidine kinase [Acidimicrobiia bacterium]